jgi:hypothetical protein
LQRKSLVFVKLFYFPLQLVPKKLLKSGFSFLGVILQIKVDGEHGVDMVFEVQLVFSFEFIIRKVIIIWKFLLAS